MSEMLVRETIKTNLSFKTLKAKRADFSALFLHYNRLILRKIGCQYWYPIYYFFIYCQLEEWFDILNYCFEYFIVKFNVSLLPSGFILL